MEMVQGYCVFCGEARMVEVPEEASQELVDQAATSECMCSRAVMIRERTKQKEACICNIEALLEPKHKEIAEMFKEAIDTIQDAKIKKITVNTYGNKTARISKTKDGIKVELEQKSKAETLA